MLPLSPEQQAEIEMNYRRVIDINDLGKLPEWFPAKEIQGKLDTYFKKSTEREKQ